MQNKKPIICHKHCRRIDFNECELRNNSFIKSQMTQRCGMKAPTKWILSTIFFFCSDNWIRNVRGRVWVVPTSVQGTTTAVAAAAAQKTHCTHRTKEINKLKLNENKIKLPIIIGHLTSVVINLYDYWLTATTSNKMNTKICDISDNGRVLFSIVCVNGVFFCLLARTLALFIRRANDNSKDLYKSWPNKCDVSIKC